MNILYIAYSCSPDHGSEDKIGWNVPVECAKNHNVFVVTKEEHRYNIERYLKEAPIKNIKFIYVDIPSIYKRIFSGPIYSGRLNIWNRWAFVLVEEICKQERIDVIHQITPIEFRSIGDYGKIPGVKFVCGPIGGGEYIPRGLKCYARRWGVAEGVRATANWWYRLRFRLNKKLKKIDRLIFANAETAAYLKVLLPKEQKYDIRTEIGIATEELSRAHQTPQKNKCNFLVAGRLVYRKGHSLLLDAIDRLPKDLNITCRVVGDGPELGRLQKLCKKNAKLKSCVEFVGAVSYQQMTQAYEEADVLVMPSLRETTGTVLIEAMSKGIPVITIGKFGGALLLDDETGWLYTGVTVQEFVENLKNAIIDCAKNPEEVLRRGQNAREAAEEHTWEKKLKYYQDCYENFMTDTK